MTNFINTSYYLKFMITRFKYIFFFLLIAETQSAQEFDTLSYLQKFDVAVNSYKEGRYKLAESYFKSILINDRNYEDPPAQLLMAKSQYNQNKFVEAIRSSNSLLSNYPNSVYETQILILLGDIFLKQEKFTIGFEYYLMARKRVEDILYLNEIDKRLSLCLSIGLREEKIEGLLFQEKDVSNRAIINLSRAYQAYYLGVNYDFKIILDSIDPYYLPSYFTNIYSRLKSSENKDLARAATVAVLLPLTGKSRQKGESYLLGLSKFLEVKFNHNYIRFLIYDTGGIGANTLMLLKKINQNKNIIAVLGPITREGIHNISGLDLDLPVFIPKSTPSHLPELAQNLFFLSPSIETIARRTAQMMIQELGFTKIAVLSPADIQSKISTDHFIDACFQMGIDPVAIEWYIEKPINISKQLKNIRKMAWDLIPEEELEKGENLKIDSLDALFDVDVTDFFELPKEQIESMSKNDSSKVVLETIQAIYIPIRPDELRYVGTQLPVYNFNTLIFGNENWLNMKLLNKDIIGPHVQGMRIVSDISAPMYDDQDNLFKNYYLLAVDQGKFLNSLILKSNFKRKRLFKELRRSDDFHGDHISIAFKGLNKNESGSSQVLEYKNKKIKTLGVYDGETFSHTIE